MIEASLAALAIGLLAPFARATSWGVPLTLFSWAMALRAAIGAALTTFFLGAALTLVTTGPRAAAIAAAFGGTFMLLSARRARHLRGVALLSYGITQPDARDAARAALDRKLAHCARRLPASHYAELALFASVPLTAVGLWDDAQRHVEAVDVGQLEEASRPRVLQALATVRIQRGDLEGAQEAVDRVERPAEEAVERWLGATETLLLAVQGNVEETLARAEAADRDDVAIAAAYDVAKAHALACSGDDEGAKKALLAVRESAGKQALERALRPVGPATDLARALLAE
ncbi:MAG TPA: hypothetical protein RMH85_11515 [Polyangiaceae bacterium LLY-WYZ-15_(1-7)]|nr:hypothetical protein [Polyangiaceae bacterium LLY-WYZ-15_(1-7)]HJL09124.1 hypothetical protein [Polyangiaceae bacterium LLY-WYZ-15_(1-7)]HJL22955.1 hypothetical protein [Polyangiaceae bacterium LLY-WYZ-15_(1-7)]HJL38230.1 hypothetical protein [Polyangiaceae bacterium LLY-WYZ-15_(1-7)]HJL48613.1 hypothetical protein [Polyangiaceae bacterium LLY-WYZ-15_(1-7)]